MTMKTRKNPNIISVIGLGYVGLPLACAFAEKFDVIGFDLNQSRVDALLGGVDATGECEPAQLDNPRLLLTTDSAKLNQATFHIVAVPTPIDDAQQPNLKPLLGASETIGKVLKPGDIVVYESTVYPGATEEDCVPVLERVSGLKAGQDFFVGYSPERINPGDKEHTFKKIMKIVSGQTPETLEQVAEVYGAVVEAGVYKASSIRVAEAAKVIENTQRDLNIALVNELAVIFNELGIDTTEVLQAAGTKWNFLPFKPGLVGGHCIGVDPYYLTHRAKKAGIHPEVILAGRKTNDGMGQFIAEQTIKRMSKLSLAPFNTQIAILGFAFKENCPDTRNTKVIDIYHEFQAYGATPLVCDPEVSADEVSHEYGVALSDMADVRDAEVVVLAVAHKAFTPVYENIKTAFPQLKLLLDVKSAVPAALQHGSVEVWRL
ncbi:MAG: GDP-mannose dehydrogenase [Gammaproteobacteria bacterium CG11_big_fil_rev_8_21_14_0_20_46_22]|nr:MAG: GDP-mannose dehydrogenase [Gammaproteobacteria bacterium CG12_big_fil_rev_8_21_14_0_65_46_12]PIR12108.1 MAG: GDP-mannose dehydrogenase [Gammaproteobacteria bacterium CG11_big_fil_rev_8_21_14_0_20_46_22]